MAHVDLRVIAVALLLIACHRRPHATSEPHALSNQIDFAKPEDASQIQHGIWEIENHAWRWTAGRFSVRLKPPLGVRGSTLKLLLTVPQPVIDHDHSVTLTCTVNGIPLPPQTWSAVGDYVFSREVPPIGSSNQAVVECSVDKVIPPGPVDKRELGIIVKRIQLEAR